MSRNEKHRTRNVFLAGKVDSPIRREIQRLWPASRGVKFMASDIICKMARVTPRSECEWAGGWDHSENAMLALNACDFLIAILEDTTAYGSIAEIAYAVAKGKRCYLWVYEDGVDDVSIQDEECPYHGEQYDKTDAMDTYMFVANMANPGCLDFGFLHGQFISHKQDSFRTEQVWWTDDSESWREFVEYVLLKERAILPPEELLDRCESPIEQMFLTNLLLKPAAKALNPIPNYKVGSYRLDVAFVHHKVGIELDGHDYHKTREQRTHDAERQRWLEMNGWRIVRFTGTEVYRNVESCVKQAISFVEKLAQSKA